MGTLPLGAAAGGNKGMMGAIAQTVYRGLGEGSVIGVIPETLKAIEVFSPFTSPSLDLLV